ncbi:MAG: phosphotransferase enzyme family protein, partial [Isosphaeraceae bacterium]
MIDRRVFEVLARYPRRSRPLDQPEPLGGAGGLSGARLWRFRSERGPLVLRAWPPHGHDRGHLEQVHRWLAQAGDLGFIPVPIADLVGATLQDHQGQLWELSPWMPGAAESARPPAIGRVRSAFAALGALHQRLAAERREGPSPGVAQRLAEVAGLARGGFVDLERAIGRVPGPPSDPARTSAARWLTLARAVAPRLIEPLREAASRVVPLQPCLRDARPEHFLFEGDCVTGLVDFGAMGVDCVASDLARLAGEWLDPEGDSSLRAEAMAAYERVRPLGAGEAVLIEAFAASTALLIGERWVRWEFVEGRRF